MLINTEERFKSWLATPALLCSVQCGIPTMLPLTRFEEITRNSGLKALLYKRKQELLSVQADKLYNSMLQGNPSKPQHALDKKRLRSELMTRTFTGHCVELFIHTACPSSSQQAWRREHKATQINVSHFKCPAGQNLLDHCSLASVSFTVLFNRTGLTNADSKDHVEHSGHAASECQWRESALI